MNEEHQLQPLETFMNDTEIWLANDRVREAHRQARTTFHPVHHRGRRGLLERLKGRRR